jgi:type IV pilus assembly protein PilY1
MRKILVTLLLLISFVTYSQTGVGYINYTSYKTHNGTGTTNQYAQFPYTAAEFDNILNTANSNTTITHTGEVTLATMCDGSTGTPHWNSDFYAIKFEFWFVPKETGSYRFGINSDDASDISVDGTIISTYYGGHGAGGYQIGSINLVAGD